MSTIKFLQNYVITLTEIVDKNGTLTITTKYHHVKFGEIYEVTFLSAISFRFADKYHISGVAQNVQPDVYRLMNYPGKPMVALSPPGCHTCRGNKI